MKLNKLFGMLAVLGFMLQLGTVGALENDVIGLGQSLIQLGFGGVIFFVGLKGLRCI